MSPACTSESITSGHSLKPHANLSGATLLRCVVAMMYAVCVSTGVLAQPLFTKSNLPTVPTSYIMQSAQSAGVVAMPGGLKMNWDYSNLVPQKNIFDTIRIVDPRDLQGEVPPEANVAILSSLSGRREYFNTLAPSLRSLGYEDDVIKAVSGTNPYDVEPIPLGFNSTYANTYNGSVEIKNQPDLRIQRSGSVKFTPDGQGQLRLPGSPVDLASIRVRWDDEITDTLFRNDIALYSARTTSTKWVWMEELGCKEYLVITRGGVVFTRISENPPKDSLFESVKYLVKDNTSDIHDSEDASLLVMPNPVSDRLFISSEYLLNSKVDVVLCSVLGEELFHQSLHSTSTLLSIPVPSQICASQTLLLRVSVNGRSISRMITVMR